MMKTTAASLQSSTMTTTATAAFPLILPPDRQGEHGADGGRNSTRLHRRGMLQIQTYLGGA
jgi:hypothetical protein